ncbi:hypothetical protein HYFRA_00004260 [Hymenoscyphus fraxineus]|uniref:C3H1-type domain-containing protein n=1 Tax=Hymenoscyphus fraxineus TaxID=746836 RepID=A0A9N9KMB1_9HELO|nr:hypothetical protein HYFRA_00004260 [Hymenoscyphus fraxineus]
MEGNQGHGYIQEDHGYDELLNNGGWPGANDQFLYGQQTQQPQDLYARYNASQQPSSFDHFDLQPQPHPSYQQPITYTNSPYTHAPQFQQHQAQHQQPQHGRSSDMFAPSSTTVDPSLQSSAPYQSHTNIAAHPNQLAHQTQNTSYSIAPNATQYVQYSMAPSQPSSGPQAVAYQQPQNTVVNNFAQRPQPQAHQAVYFNEVENSTMQRNVSNPINYGAVPVQNHQNQQSQQPVQPKPAVTDMNPSERIYQSINTSSMNHVKNKPVDMPSPSLSQPRVIVKPYNPLRMVKGELLPKKNDTISQRLVHAPFVAFGSSPIQINLNLKNTIPKYHPRKSKSGKELVPGFNSSRKYLLSASLPNFPRLNSRLDSLVPARPSTKKERHSKHEKPSTSIWKGTSGGFKPSVGKVVGRREDNTSKTSTPTDSSTSEDESSSEEESEYEEPEMPPIQDVSEIRGAIRPTALPAGTRWDVIGVIWRDPNTSPNAKVVQEAIEEYYEIISSLRAKLKEKKEAEAAAGPAQAEKFKNERRILLDALYEAVNAADTLGYVSIVENLGGHQRLVNALTSTLIECTKAKPPDLLGKLPRAVFSLLAKFQTMTDALLEKLKFGSIAKRWTDPKKNNGTKASDEKIDKDIAAIKANTIDAKERAVQAKKDAAKVEEQRKVLNKIEQTKSRIEGTNKPSPLNPAKRPHEGDSTNGKPNKKFASDVAGVPATKPTFQKKTNLLGISTKPAARPIVKKKEPSPPPALSKFSALLDSIHRPPSPPKAAEVPSGPPETPEEKARRERKESRRHLRVKFKEGDALEEIRIFKKDKSEIEDEGRQPDALRDAHDIGSEGMMHKRRVSEAIEEDDENQPEDPESRPYPALIEIDFSDLMAPTKFGRKYTTRGGDRTFTTPEQQTQERREAIELMVTYMDTSDIPPTPKEPSLAMGQIDGAADEDITPVPSLKGPTEAWIIQRLHEIRQYGPEYATKFFLARLEEQRSQGRMHGMNSGQNTPAQPQQIMPVPAKIDLAAYQTLLDVVESLKGKPYPPTEPPEWMTDPNHIAIWWEGYNRDEAAKPRPEVVVPIEQTQYQPQVVVPAPQVPMYAEQAYQPQPPQPQASMSAPNDIASQVQNLLAGYGNGGNAPANQQFDYTAWAAAQMQAQAEAQAQSYNPSQQQPNWDSPQWDDQQDNSNKQPKQRGYKLKEWNGGNQKPLDTSIFDENGEYKGKKRPCTFFGKGLCKKGAGCTFLHS